MVKKVVLALLIIGILIFGIKKVTNNKVVKNDNNNLAEIKNKNSVLTEEEKMKIIDEIKIALENKTDKEVLSVNGEKITEREIAYYNYQINNSAVNENGKTKDVVNEIIKQYVICQNAQELGISLTENEIERIKEVVKDDETIRNQAETLNMSYDEVRKMYVNGRTKMQLKEKWRLNTFHMINDGKLVLDNKEFNNKYKKYCETDDAKIKHQLVLELIEIYVEYLVDKSNIEYIK